MNLDAIYTRSPQQREIMHKALTNGQFVAASERENNLCRKLNAAQLLRRDAKSAFLWFPSENALLRAGVSRPEDGIVGKNAEIVVLEEIQSAELVVVIERARSLFDAGDIKQALKVSSVAYDQAKAAAASAERVKASRDLIDKARRMQADAVKIESMCYVAMADAVDEGQQKGQILRKGQRADVHGADFLSLSEIGIDKRRLSEARQVRDAVKADPEFIDRVISARL